MFNRTERQPTGSTHAVRQTEHGVQTGPSTVFDPQDQLGGMPIVREGNGSTAKPAAMPQWGDRIDLKVLVLCPTVDDLNLAAITSALAHMGVPYDVVAVDREKVTETHLWHGAHAHYQGVIMTSGNLAYWNHLRASWSSPWDAEQKRVLAHFQARFGIRQVTMLALPYGEAGDYGLQITRVIDTYGKGINLHLTQAGQQIFPYLNASCQLPVASVAAFAAQPADSAVPLLVTGDGDTMAALYCDADGRESLALTFAHSRDTLHTKLLAQGLINWVTKGLFVGQRRVYLSIHIDDIFNSNRLWDPETLSATTGEVYRLNERDVNALLRWMEDLNARRNCADLTLDFAFNGANVASSIETDALAASLLPHQSRFRWINHGFTHLPLDQADYEETSDEIQHNNEVARQLGLLRHDDCCMVTAGVSGLRNPDFLAAAGALGIRYLVSDTSQPNGDNPSPNTGISTPHHPDILVIPRHPNNLFFNVSTPEEWLSQYNYLYYGLWQRELTLDEILDYEARVLLNYMLASDMDPLMFHQANLRAFDGKHSLLSLLIDRTIALYNTFCGDLPIISLGMSEIGHLMEMHTLAQEAQIHAMLTVGKGVELRSDRELMLPLTGAAVSGRSEMYAGQPFSKIYLQPYEAFRVPRHHLADFQTGRNEYAA